MHSYRVYVHRREAAAQRLLALITLILCHPAAEQLIAFLQTLPELAQELVDLVRSR